MNTAKAAVLRVLSRTNAFLSGQNCSPLPPTASPTSST